MPVYLSCWWKELEWIIQLTLFDCIQKTCSARMPWITCILAVAASGLANVPGPIPNSGLLHTTVFPEKKEIAKENLYISLHPLESLSSFPCLMPALPLVHHRRHRTIQVLQLNSSGLEMVMFNICHFKHPRARLHHLPNSVLHICISPEAAAWLFSCHGIMITITFLDYLKHSLEGLDGNSSNETVRKHSCRST